MASFRLGPFLPRASAACGFFSSLPHLYIVIYLLIVSSQEAVDRIGEGTAELASVKTCMWSMLSKCKPRRK